MHDNRELEDLIVDTIYLGLIGGKLDSKNEKVHVEFTVGRDLMREDLEEIRRVLAEWEHKAVLVTEMIEKKVNEARGRLQQDVMLRGEHEKRVKEITENIAQLQVKFDGTGRNPKNNPGRGPGGRRRRTQKRGLREEDESE